MIGINLKVTFPVLLFCMSLGAKLSISMHAFMVSSNKNPKMCTTKNCGNIEIFKISYKNYRFDGTIIFLNIIFLHIFGSITLN